MENNRNSMNVDVPKRKQDILTLTTLTMTRILIPKEAPRIVSFELETSESSRYRRLIIWVMLGMKDRDPKVHLYRETVLSVKE